MGVVRCTRVPASANVTLLLVLLVVSGCTTRLDFTTRRDAVAVGAGAGATPAGGGASGGASGGEGGQPEQRGDPTFQEECDAPLDPARLRTEMLVGATTFRSWGGRADWMADENVTVEDGLCIITAEDTPNGDRQFTSGVISTAGLFSQRYGRFEARLRAPAGTGLWPIFWLRALEGWPPAIDVAAFHGHDAARFNAGLWYRELDTTSDASSTLALDWSENFHVYSVDWSPSGLSYAVDGAVWFESAEGLGTFDAPLHPVINLSLSDGSDGSPAASAATPLPARLELDWLRIYALP